MRINFLERYFGADIQKDLGNDFILHTDGRLKSRIAALKSDKRTVEIIESKPGFPDTRVKLFLFANQVIPSALDLEGKAKALPHLRKMVTPAEYLHVEEDSVI